MRLPTSFRACKPGALIVIWATTTFSILLIRWPLPTRQDTNNDCVNQIDPHKWLGVVAAMGFLERDIHGIFKICWLFMLKFYTCTFFKIFALWYVLYIYLNSINLRLSCATMGFLDPRIVYIFTRYLGDVGVWLGFWDQTVLRWQLLRTVLTSAYTIPSISLSPLLLYISSYTTTSVYYSESTRYGLPVIIAVMLCCCA